MLQRQGAGIEEEEAPPPPLEAPPPVAVDGWLPLLLLLLPLVALLALSPFEAGGACSRRACSK